MMNNTTFWLTNVRLESGYHRENGLIAGTETEICNIRIENGMIAEIQSHGNPQADGPGAMVEEGAVRYDAGTLLALPSFVNSHCHLDKTLMGTGWRAQVPVQNIFGRFEVEANVLAGLPLSTAERAENLLEIMLRSGTTHLRTHVDIYPSAGLSNLEGVQEALSRYEDKVTHEIVAFPQHGLLRTNSAGLVREAVRRGATHVGGIDPATVDGDIEAALQQMMEIAVEENAGVDLHLHDPGHLGLFTIKRLAALTVEAGWQGRVSISHAFSLGDVSASEAANAAEMLAESGVTIVTHVPINRAIPPVPLLTAKGVKVAVGTDNIFDNWQPYGNGDMLERAGRLAERFRWSDERSLAQTLGYITDGRTPLDREGNRVWPRIGDEANFVLVHASCSAEAVARRAKVQGVFHQGQVVSGHLSKS